VSAVQATVAADQIHRGIHEGVDYSFDRPSPTGLVAVGKVFACRYVGAGGGPKMLGPIEAHQLNAAGLRIVSIVEGASSSAMGGWPLGVSHATLARQWHLDNGFPWPVPCYFAVDFQVVPDEWGTVREYLRGAASVIGLDHVGVYGGYQTVQWARTDDVARWFCQTYAWSGGLWMPGNHIEQYRNDVSLVGGTVDLCRAMVENYGGWTMTEPQAQANPVELETRSILYALGAGLDNATEHQQPWNVPLTGLYSRIAEDTVTEIGQAISDGRLDIPGASSDGLTESDRASLASLHNDVALLGTTINRLANQPLVDPVAVASAIATNPDILAALAKGVAGQLSTIHGSLTLSGDLSASIDGPVQR
jgi:Domain of unknown function (DUF1906)